MSFFKIVKGLKHKKDLENKIIKLEKEIKILDKEIYNLQYNAAYIELLARKNLAMCKTHEIIYKFNNSSNNLSKDAKNN